MACDIHYLLERKVILTRLYGELSAQDSQKFNQQNIELIRCGNGSVHIIFDITALNHIDLNVREMLGLMSFRREPQLGWVFIVGGPSIGKFMGMLVLEAGSVNYRFVKTMDEARTALTRLDPELVVQ